MLAFEKGVPFSGVLNFGSFLSNGFVFFFQMVEPLMGGATLGLSPGGSLSNHGCSLRTYLICSAKLHFHPQNDTYFVFMYT